MTIMITVNTVSGNMILCRMLKFLKILIFMSSKFPPDTAQFPVLQTIYINKYTTLLTHYQ